MKIFWFLGVGDDARADSAQPSDSLRAPRLVLWVTFLALAAFGAWAHLAEIDQVTRAPGTVIASSRTQVIQSQEGGTLESLLVREGDTVERGQVLARLERTRTETAYLETRAKAVGLAATVARLRAEVLGGAPKWPSNLSAYPQFRENQLSLLRKRRAAIEEDIASQTAIARLLEQELAMNRPLLESGDVSRTEVLRLERQLADVKAQIVNRRNKYFQDAQAELSKAEEELASVEQVLAQRKDLLEQTELRAPMAGVVKNVAITTRGGVIRSGEEVMQIVPLEDDLLVEARVSPADIAFIRPGQNAAVKIDAYDYTIYGDLAGTLTFISADTVREKLREGESPYYLVQVRTSGRQFSGKPDAKLEIQPGMTATVEIRTGSNTVLHYLTKPLVKTISESLGER
jgi:adhesin transport system membrane fusion protein